MTNEPVTRSSTSYYTQRMADAKLAMGLPVEAPLDDLLKKILAGGTIEMTFEQWMKYGARFAKDERA